MAGWEGGRGQLGQQTNPVASPNLAYVSPQGNQMSITFLEPSYPAPGHVHRGQLQLVEVSGAAWTSAQSKRLRFAGPTLHNGKQQEAANGRRASFLVIP
jgi:hypothetical protein